MRERGGRRGKRKSEMYEQRSKRRERRKRKIRDEANYRKLMSSEEWGIAIREGEGGCRERLVSQREVCYSLQGCASDVNTPPNEAVWGGGGRKKEGVRKDEEEERGRREKWG